MPPKASPKPVSDDALAEALKKALSGELVKLVGTAAVPGVFPSGAAGKPVLAKALAEGYVEEGPPVGKKASGLGRITDKGRGFVLSRSDPRTLAEALVAQVRAVAEETRALRQKLDAAEQSARSILAAFDSSVQRLAASMSAPKAASPVSAAWEEDLLRLVREAKARNAFTRPTLPILFDELRKVHPGVDLGAYHDGLRRMHEAKKIRLGAFGQPLAVLPDSRNALYLDREVKFYVDLVD